MNKKLLPVLEQVVTVLSRFTDYIQSSTVLAAARILPGSFSRNRLISLKDLLFFLMFRQGNTCNEEISFFFQNRQKVPSKQALIKRESLLNFDVWKKLLLYLFRQLEDAGLLARRYKGYRVIAIDGSTGSMPCSPALKQYFGGPLNQACPTKDDLMTPVSRFSAVYDVLNHFILGFMIRPFNSAEIPMMMEQLNELLPLLEGQKVLFVMDRNYASVEFFLWCRMHGFDYLVRAKDNFYKEERKTLSQKQKQGVFTVHITYAWSRRIKDKEVRLQAVHHPDLEIRLIRSDFTYTLQKPGRRGGFCREEMTVHAEFFTSLPFEIGVDEAVDTLYKELRWDIETFYDIEKNDIELENVHSAGAVALLNMLNARVLFFNIEMILYSIAQDQIEEKYIPNNAKIIHECKNFTFLEKLMNRALDTKFLKKIIQEALRYKRKVQKNRHYQRWGRFFKNIPQKKFRIDGRANPKVIKCSAGYVTTDH